MDENHVWLADRFEQERGHLQSVAYRMLGSLTEADDAVQDAWVRVSRSGTDGVENFSAWLTTIVARICLNMLRSRNRRREEPIGVHVPDPVIGHVRELCPEEEVLLADSVGLALLVVLDTLTPAERLAFVLHDMFELPFEEIAPLVVQTYRRRIRTSLASKRWSTPFCLPHGEAISTPLSPCSTPRSCFASMPVSNTLRRRW
jgi:RNA polymerase sigma-70 factor (ECF subfamily)